VPPRHQGRRSDQRRRRDATARDQAARGLAGPLRNPDAPHLHERCLSPRGRPSSPRRREGGLSSRMGLCDSPRPDLIRQTCPTVSQSTSWSGARMTARVERRTVDLSGYPDLVVIYLGMRVRGWRGLRTLLGLGPQIDRAGADRPAGLLHFENNIIFSLFPFISACAGTGRTTKPWSGGPDPSRTATGG